MKKCLVLLVLLGIIGFAAVGEDQGATVEGAYFQVGGILLVPGEEALVEGGKHQGDYGDTRVGTKAAYELSEEKRIEATSRLAVKSLICDAIDIVWFPGRTTVKRAIDKELDALEKERDTWKENSIRLKEKYDNWDQNNRSTRARGMGNKREYL